MYPQSSFHPTQITEVTFKEIQSNVLQGSKVVLDVEEEYLDERTILTLDAATRITSSGIACFSSLDGKQHCFENALPGQCESENSFGPEGRRHLEFGRSWWSVCGVFVPLFPGDDDNTIDPVVLWDDDDDDRRKYKSVHKISLP